MNENELIELETGIREALAEFGLEWVLADIEEGIKAKRRIDVVVPSRRTVEQESLLTEETHLYVVPTLGHKGQTMVGDVAVDPRERVEVAIEALRRLMVELPEIHEDTVNRLAETDDRDSMADDMAFSPDEDDSAPPVPGIETVRASAGQRREAAEFLLRLHNEVMG